MIYLECLTLQQTDVTHLYKDWASGSGFTLVLYDFTHNGENDREPHPSYLKYYKPTPYWVQVIDGDDYVMQKEFASLQDAYKFYYEFLLHPDNCLKEME